VDYTTFVTSVSELSTGIVGIMCLNYII